MCVLCIPLYIGERQETRVASADHVLQRMDAVLKHIESLKEKAAAKSITIGDAVSASTPPKRL